MPRAWQGYPEEIKELPDYDPNFFQRGLMIDKERGNVIKMDRHSYVKVAYHVCECVCVEVACQGGGVWLQDGQAHTPVTEINGARAHTHTHTYTGTYPGDRDQRRALARAHTHTHRHIPR